MEMLMILVFVMAVVAMRICIMLVGKILTEYTFFDWCHLVAKVYACLVECNRIKGSKHSDIWNDWNIVF